MSIVQFPNTILTTPTNLINVAEVKETVVDGWFKHLIKLLKQTDTGVAIAANQGGLNCSMFVYQDALKCAEVGMHVSSFEGVINPEIISVSGSREQVEFPEGCLSFDGKPYLFKGLHRYPSITVNYWTWPGMVEVRGHYLEGFDAQMFQHEIDHLMGKTIYDRLV